MEDLNVKQLLDYLKNNGYDVTITIKTRDGLTADQVEEARKAGHEGREIRFSEPDTTL